MFVNDNISRKEYASTFYGLDHNIVRPATKRSQSSIKVIQWMTLINVHTPSRPKIIITPIRVSKKKFNMSLIITQKNLTQKYTNSIPIKKYHNCNNSHTLHHKIQVNKYLGINQIFMTWIFSTRNLKKGIHLKKPKR